MKKKWCSLLIAAVMMLSILSPLSAAAAGTVTLTDACTTRVTPVSVTGQNQLQKPVYSIDYNAAAGIAAFTFAQDFSTWTGQWWQDKMFFEVNSGAFAGADGLTFLVTASSPEVAEKAGAKLSIAFRADTGQNDFTSVNSTAKPEICTTVSETACLYRIPFSEMSGGSPEGHESSFMTVTFDASNLKDVSSLGQSLTFSQLGVYTAAETEVEAEEADVLTITVNTAGGGSVDAALDGERQYDGIIDASVQTVKGSVLTLTAKETDRRLFDCWQKNGETVSQEMTLTVNDAADNDVYTAVWVDPPTEAELRAGSAITALGDWNKDGEITVTDALETLRYSVGLVDTLPFPTDGHENPLFYADLDGNGDVTVSDALLALRISVGLNEQSLLYQTLPVREFSSAVIPSEEGSDEPALITDSDQAPTGYDESFFAEHDLICFSVAAVHPSADQVVSRAGYLMVRCWNDGLNEDIEPVCLAVSIPKGYADEKSLCVSVLEPTVNLLFDDEFSGDTLNDAKWERCPEQSRGGGGSFWRQRLSNLSGDGRLLLQAEWDAANKRVDAGAVRTRGRFEAGFGYYEASIRFPVATGVWGAFWMMVGNVNNVDDSSADGVEIDIVETAHNEVNRCNQALHWDGYGPKHTVVSKTETIPEIYDGEFHKFGLWRSETAYIFYVDDREVWRSTGKGICPLDGYMKLSVESAAWAGGGSAACIAALPTVMEVDYVRVWETNPYQS